LIAKGADVIERLSEVTEVCFDKTGTLTRGQLDVVRWTPREEAATEALLTPQA
jgi:P-type E1-E2 ATPase